MRYLLFPFCLSACGASPVLATNVQVYGLEPADVASVELAVLANHTSAGEPVDCAALGSDLVAAHAELEVLFTRVVSLETPALSGVPIGTGLIFVADAYASEDALGVRLGRACRDHVEMLEGRTNKLSLAISPL
jgi:hypothetical protein